VHHCLRIGFAFGLMVALALPAAARAGPPLLDQPAARQGPSQNDVALVIGIGDYAFVADVPYADRDARAFAAYLIRTRGVAADRVRVLLDGNATREAIGEGLDWLAATATPQSTVWVYFAGHGLPSPDGQDGLLAGADVQQTAASIAARSLSRKALVDRAGAAPAARAVVLIDACFSGQSRDGKAVGPPGMRPLVRLPALRAGASTVVMSAAGADEASGPYDSVKQGLFTYFAVGGLRGWADGDGDKIVTVEELHGYVRRAMATVLSDGSRRQTPQLELSPDDARQAWWLARAVSEAGPDLAALSAAEAPRAEVAVSQVRLGEVPALEGRLLQGGAVGLGDVDADVLVAYDAAVRADARGRDDPDGAARAWEALAVRERGNPYRTESQVRARQWRDYSRRKTEFAAQRAADEIKLRKVLPLASVGDEQKRQLVRAFGEVYGADSVPPLVTVVRPEALRAELCARFVAAGAGERVTVQMPTVDGKPLAGVARVDGHAVGDVPGIVRVAACAVSLEVVVKGDKSWRAPAQAIAAVHFAKPTFPGVFEDGSPEAAREKARREAGFQWGWIAFAGAVAGGSAWLDTQPASAKNARLDVLDFVPIAGYVTAALVAINKGYK